MPLLLAHRPGCWAVPTLRWVARVGSGTRCALQPFAQGLSRSSSARAPQDKAGGERHLLPAEFFRMKRSCCCCKNVRSHLESPSCRTCCTWETSSPKKLSSVRDSELGMH